jgi:hypothetical protein
LPLSFSFGLGEELAGCLVRPCQIGEREVVWRQGGAQQGNDDGLD